MCLNFFSHEIILFSHHFPFLPLRDFENQTHSLKSTNLRPVGSNYLCGRGKGEGKLDWKSLISVIFIDKYL